MSKHIFWNNRSNTAYFASKPADPRIIAFLEDIEVSNSQRALDLGCGGGRHSEMLSKMGYELHAVDANSGMLRRTKSRLSEQNLPGRVIEASILQLPFRDNYFDIVVATGVLHQAESVEEYWQAIHEMSRTMKEGAFVLLNVFTNVDDDDSFTVVSDDGLTVKTTEGLLMTLLNVEMFNRMMSDVGLVLVENQGESASQENTGRRTTYRAVYKKLTVKE